MINLFLGKNDFFGHVDKKIQRNIQHLNKFVYHYKEERLGKGEVGLSPEYYVISFI
jgi:hypothetical protein